ncbi:hypothetical protein [Helicobacter sp. 13S00477-4]|uniref:hypothetical protein n=1 Tax=Helicobacter sp. 13S00477-4 TaxID=1905759 RepID=UPI000BA535D6|nr:hypothetical protein [Helicobacter sp. 13S00477-4]PAF51955.1 hypothetical protein BKH44_04655 [Helicobacter sp. 13S00477-4]
MGCACRIGLIGQVCFLVISANAQSYLELFDTQIGFFSSGGFGKYGQSHLRGGYTNFFGSLGVKSMPAFGFDFAIGVSGIGLLHKVKNKDMYSNIMNDEIGIGFRINNDEAKDFRYTSTDFVLHTVYGRYKNSWGYLVAGRFPLNLEWIGDYVEGVNVVIDRFKGWEISAGWFDKQAYANAQENVSYGYIKQWYQNYEGYKIKNNYFLDMMYQNDSLNFNAYYNYFDTLLYVLGMKGSWEWGYDNWKIKTLLHYAFVNASEQSSEYCQDPSLAVVAGLECYIPGSMGSITGYLWQIQENVKYKNWDFSIGYIQNDKRNSTNNLPIYSDDSPLEYNTAIYGGGAKTGYVTFRYEYRGRYSLGLKYGLSGYGGKNENSLQGQFNALAGVDFARANISFGYINIDDSSGYKNNIAKIWLGFKF